MSLFRSSGLSLCVLILFFSSAAFAQDRQRVVKTVESAPTNAPTVTVPKKTTSTSRPTLTNSIVVQNQPSLVKKTTSAKPTTAAPAAAVSKNAVGVDFSMRSDMMGSIQSKLGIPYLYGSTGPNRYDCSGFVWAVFNESGVDFLRSSARTFWNDFEPVTGDDRYKFGTLVFFNGLGHVGIVVDENGFYHASSSKGVTYSKFAGYWEKRIVGFRRIPIDKYAAQPDFSK